MIVIGVVVAVVLLVVVGGLVTVARRRTGDGTLEAERPPTRPPHAPPDERVAPRGTVAPAGLGARIRALFRGGLASEQTWRDLEEALVRADLGPRAASRVVDRVRAAYGPGTDPAALVAREVAAAFRADGPWSVPTGSPAVVMVVGVNGTGKTTTIGKLAALLRAQGASVTLAASDTFRAAAGEQLDTWAGRAGAHLVAQERGADPAAVAFDAVRSAKARGSNVLIVDTAGRLHTRTPLMEELRKVRRVLEKAGGRVAEVLLVLDATTGQNGIAQARAFTEAVGVTVVVLTKMDGTARGGIVLAVREELGVPVRFVGTGEGVHDLAPFDPEAFARGLVA
jgi:fused signal recognition particle receptor